jgi:hypothetical protein
LLEAGVDFVGQFRVVEHFLVGDENLADGLGLAAFDQALMSRRTSLSACLRRSRSMAADSPRSG